MEKLLSQTVNGVLRQFSAQPAYAYFDGRSNLTSRHGMEFFFSVQRGDAAVEVLWMTPWELATSRNIGSMRGSAFAGLGQVNYHSPVALYLGDTISTTNCVMTGGDCYCANSILEAGVLFDLFVAEPASLWRELENRLEQLEKDIATERFNARNL